jgi:hypothetical protein
MKGGVPGGAGIPVARTNSGSSSIGGIVPVTWATAIDVAERLRQPPGSTSTP